jgi:hypothetical protein
MIRQWEHAFLENAAYVFNHHGNEANKMKREMEAKEERYQKIIG